MLHYAGPAVMELKEKIAQSEQGKAQLEHALSAQAKHSRAVEAELTSANARTKQLEVRLHCYLPYGSQKKLSRHFASMTQTRGLHLNSTQAT